MIKYLQYYTILIFPLISCYTPDYNPEDTIIPPVSESICDEIMDVSEFAAKFSLVDVYNIGDFISPEHQTLQFDYCYPSDSSGNSFSFSSFQNSVFVLEMAATW